MSCEHCWTMAQMRGISYEAQIRDAEDNHAACTRDDEAARKLRAGQFWDDELKVDRRRTTP